MAKVKYGEMITDARGSIGGTTHSKNRYGNYMKKKSHPINRQTSAQNAVRAFFTTLTQGWAALTAAQKSSWRNVTLNFQRVNSLAETIQLTGHQLYIAINRNLQTIASALITTAPAKAVVGTIGASTWIADVSLATIVQTFGTAIPATEKTELYASAPCSAGKFSNSQPYKLIAVLTVADVTPYAATAAYELVFGAGWKVAGQQIFFLTKNVQIAGGQEGATEFSKTIVIA